MKFQNVLTNTFCASLLAISLCGTGLSAYSNDAFKSKVNLKLLDSKSSVNLSLPSNLDTNKKFFTMSNILYGSIWQQYFVGDLLISGYANLPYVPALAPTGTDAFLTSLVIHDTSSDFLDEKDRISLPAGQGVLALAISPVSDRPYIAISKITSASLTTYPGTIVPVGPYTYTLEVYKYNPDGTIVADPVDSIVWGTDFAPSGLNSSIITYNSGVNFTHDGKYLFYTYTAGTPGNLKQFMGAFAVAANGIIDTTPVAEIELPQGPIVGVDNFFPQPDTKTFIYPMNTTTYKCVAGMIGFTPGNPTGGNTQASMVQSYNFDPVAHTIVLTGDQPLPAALQGHDLNVQHDRVVVVIKYVSEDGLVVGRPANPPFPGSIPDKNFGFRIYDFNKDASNNALTYVSGHDLGSARGWHVRFSNNGDFLAMTLAPQAAVSGSLPIPPNFPVNNAVSGPSVLATFDFKKGDYQVVMQDIKPASFLSTGLAWNAEDTRVATNGSPSPKAHDIQLYKVEFND